MRASFLVLALATLPGCDVTPTLHVRVVEEKTSRPIHGVFVTFSGHSEYVIGGNRTSGNISEGCTDLDGQIVLKSLPGYNSRTVEFTKSGFDPSRIEMGNSRHKGAAVFHWDAMQAVDVSDGDCALNEPIKVVLRHRSTTRP